MPGSIVENLIKSFKSFQHILSADTQRLDEVEGIGEVRAKNIKPVSYTHLWKKN